jgi:hypothetical protein
LSCAVTFERRIHGWTGRLRRCGRGRCSRRRRRRLLQTGRRRWWNRRLQSPSGRRERWLQSRGWCRDFRRS